MIFHVLDNKKTRYWKNKIYGIKMELMLNLGEEEKGSERLRLREYPYTYARISAMKAKLIKKDMYSKLMKMGINEITRYMQETEYKKEIDELASTRRGIELIENALNINMLRTFIKLKKISEDKSLRELIEAYMMRRDIWNIKTILRGRHSRQKDEEVKELILPLGKLDESFFIELMKKESVEEIAKSLKFIRFEHLMKTIPAYREKKNLFELENALDHDYYSYLIEFSERLPRQGQFFREFVENEIDILNIKALLRLKKAGVDKRDIERHLFYPGARLGSSMLRKLAGAEDISSMLKSLQGAGYGRIAREIEKKESIIDIELKLNKYLLDKAVLLLHKHPLSVDVILGYMFAKEIEIKNLKTIIKGKQLGMSEEFIESELVIGG